MRCGHERLDVYRVSIRDLAWAYETVRIVAMLIELGQRSHEVRENPGRYDNLDYDNDNDAKVIP